MFDPDLVESMFDEQGLRGVAGAFAVIVSSGIIDAQLEREHKRIIGGFAEEDESQLVMSIREYRRRVTTLESLRQFCESMKDLS